jgi:hypothetical protein
MNPVISDLALRISATEAEADLRTRQRLAATSSPGLGTLIVRAVRQFVNPRKYALDAAVTRQPVRPVVTQVAASVTALPARRSTPEAEFPVAA